MSSLLSSCLLFPSCSNNLKSTKHPTDSCAAWSHFRAINLIGSFGRMAIGVLYFMHSPICPASTSATQGPVIPPYVGSRIQ
ncbi:hypothetical protein NA56DRAFT_134715 [Hyaloscypha hepaticicola]|uniref:Uncharacterized protein n=1 Tax=Hyaloscypha hepaticicola TaxID=2082293 RepID=A0A2J6Q4R4_9HELO|nr:hypothetical protein NA56DRAFT_134715 [Hyaloscypha hepaticicola]